MFSRDRRELEQYQDRIARLYPELRKEDDDGNLSSKTLSRTITFQVTDACNLACSYCYQINKGKRKMTFETAKKFIDLLLSGDKGMKSYVSPEFSPAIIIEFIGGEPFLEIELIDKICDYFFHECIRLDHPWATMHMFSICSNGVLYSDPRVQKFLTKHKDNVSFSITIDGNKELHDSCRVFPDGRPSYDIAVAGAMDWMRKGYYMGSKITIAPGNLEYLYTAITHMIELNYLDINANCVYEEGWEQHHATEFYYQLKKICDYVLERDLVDKIYISLFIDTFFKPKQPDDLNNWCFRAGTMISTPKGYVPIEDLNLYDEVYTKDNEIHIIEELTTHDADNGYIIKASGMFKTFTTSEHPYLCKKFLYVGNKGKYKYAKPEWIPVKDISKGDKIALSIHKFGDIEIDSHIAYVVGRYIGDGWCSVGNYKICCAFDEKDELMSKLEEANIDFSFDKYSTVYQFNILKSNKELIEIIDQCGHCAKEKHLPLNIYSWSESSVLSLLEGLFDADGYYRPSYKLQRINTVSFTLAVELLEVIRSLGYFPTCSIDERAGESIIDGRRVNIRDRYEICFKTDMSTRYMEYDEDNHVVWTTVRSVKETEENYNVYNMTVNNNHTFIANGAVVHNCGGTGLMLSCDPDGYLYPCIRYMESSLGCSRKPLRIGSVDDGIGNTEEYAGTINCLNCINRRTESTDECFYCPIAEGCSWCSAYNYQVNGTPDSRVTYICEMHKARALANAYYWSKYYERKGMDKNFELYVSRDWALKIIPEDEFNYLLSLPNVEYKGNTSWEELKKQYEE